MAITRVDPFREFNVLQERLNRLFGNTYLRDEDIVQRGSWAPPVDIFETDTHDLIIKAELPDMSREAIEVTVENNTLTLRGTRDLPSEVKEEQFHRIERRYGTFSRTFSLPPSIDAGKVSADYRDGVLTVKLPMREEAKPRQIKVEVAA